MIIADRLREFREERKLSQGDLEKRTGLLRSHLSRVENGHTTPSLDTLEKLAQALEIPLYQLLYDGDAPPPPPPVSSKIAAIGFGASGKQAMFVEKLRRMLGTMSEDNRKVILLVAQRLARRSQLVTRASKP